MVTPIPNKNRQTKHFEFACNKDEVDKRLERHLEYEMAFIRTIGGVPIVGNEVVEVSDSPWGGDNVVFVGVDIEYVDWPDAIDKIKYMTYDGYVEWINTHPNT